MQIPTFPSAPWKTTVAVVIAAMAASGATAASCEARSGPNITPVLELYTSQGCSSCPPADRWLSGLHHAGAATDRAVIQAFHVAYWDYIGWPDPFARAEHTQRQRQIASWNQLRSIYTPQVVVNGRDWRSWRQSDRNVPRTAEPAGAVITLRQHAKDQFEATVSLNNTHLSSWSAYWTVTESAHRTSVRAGENAGELLQNDYVVRQYTPAGNYRSAVGTPQTLVLHAIASLPGHTRTINLVVFDPRDGKTVQALASSC